MGMYNLDGLLFAWETEKITTEQAIGQILQQLREFDARLGRMEDKQVQALPAKPVPTIAPTPPSGPQP